MKYSGSFLAFMMLTSNAFATIEVTDNLLFSAFGSTSVTTSDHDTPIFLNREIIDDACFDCDSTLGLQLDYLFSEHFSSSIQVVKRPQDTWSDPSLEWLYIDYNYDQFDFKIGRLRLPTFLDSEYYYVAHAYIPARPPQEVYDSLLGITSYDGISLKWLGELTDEISMSVEPHGAFFGESKVTKSNTEYSFDISSVVGINVTVSSFDYRYFVNALHARYDLTLQSTGVAGVMPAFIKKMNNESLSMYSVGGEHYWDNLTLRGEAYYSTSNFNWYTQLAYCIDKFTPYVSYGEMNSIGAEQEDNNYTITAGLRVDFTPTVSMNLEVQKMTADDSPSTLSGKGQFTEYLYANEKNDANIYTLMFNFIM